jgi:hypothetical protein
MASDGNSIFVYGIAPIEIILVRDFVESSFYTGDHANCCEHWF